MTTALIRPEATASITVDEPVVLVPAYNVTDYAYGFEDAESGRDGWSSGGINPTVTPDGRTGTFALRVNMGTFSGSLARAFTGLTIGHQYTLSGWYRYSGEWTLVERTFTAASTAQAFSLPVGTGTSYWDDMRLVHHVPAVTTLTPELKITQGKIRLDENYSPYIRANFTVPLTGLDLLEQIDPRTEQRITVTATEAEAGETRTYNLGLRSRSVDHKAQTIELEAESDEILLHDRRHVATTVDSTPRQHEASMRAICNWALGKIGAALAPGTADANMTAQWDATNLLKNPAATNSSANWATGSSSTVIAHNTGAGQGGGQGFIRATQSGTTGAVFLAATTFDISAREGDMFTASVYMKHNTAGASATITLRFVDNNNATLRNVTSPAKALPTTWGTRWSVTAVAPANTAKVIPYASISGTASGRLWDLDQAMLTKGPLLVDYFDGGTPDTANYTFEWEDAANASASTRVATPQRLPELFDWKPGQSLFDFIQPLLNASGLRLFCDENRVWRLVDPAEYEVPGFVIAQTGHNAVEGTDTITRNDDTWADAVVVKYEWTGPDGNTKTAYDVAGDPNGKTITRELDREYPGPGAAAALLASFEGRGRTQSVTVVGQYGATPGQDVSVNLPGTVTQTGKVRAVEFDLGSGLMSLETRGLTDTLAGSWLLWDPTETWSEVDPTLTWTEA